MAEKINKLSVKLKYCHGIGSFCEDFSFYGGNDPCKTHLIYAANGIMKSSFTKTFQSIQNDNPKDIKDHVNDSAKPSFEIDAYTPDGKKQAITPNEICAIPSFYDLNQALNCFVNNSSKHATSLLVDSKLKNEFDVIYLDIEEKEIALINDLAISSRLENSDAVLKEILETFESDNFLELLINLKDRLELYSDDFELSNLDYSVIFSQDVLKAIDKDPSFQQKISEYLDRYNQLIRESKYFREGVFDLLNQEDVQKALEKNKFFQAQHGLYLTDKTSQGSNKPVSSLDEMKKIFNEEYSQIINEKELEKRFEVVKKILDKNPVLRNFKSSIERKRSEGKDILHLMPDPKEFKKKTWLAYLKKKQDELNSLLDLYLKNKNKLDEITEKANSETERWQETIDEFQKRFNAPFKYIIENTSDSVLGKTLPQLKTVYVDIDKKETPMAFEQLKRILSTGELRAFYILNILFEIEYRRKNKQRTLFVFDDVADSFDYKNKYAIVEYLSEILEEEFFYGIILTHNFDFFRTLKSRLSHKKAWIAEKKEIEIKGLKLYKIKLSVARKQDLEPFDLLRGKLIKGTASEEELVCMIPFARNLVQYSKGENNSEYERLTALLHIKDITSSIKFSELIQIYVKVFGIADNVAFESINSEYCVLDTIYRLAHDLEDSNDETFRIKSKLILSIASRLKTEEYIIKKIEEITGESFDLGTITRNQFRELYQAILEKTSKNGVDLKKELKIIKSVSLITPEHIHINSFMFEPILDMSFDEIKGIYNEVSNNLSVKGAVLA
jgi:hypothetical protein